jgi:hypothetical protein
MASPYWVSLRTVENGLVTLVYPRAANLQAGARAIRMDPDTFSLRVDELGLPRQKQRKGNRVEPPPEAFTAGLLLLGLTPAALAERPWPEHRQLREGYFAFVLAHAPTYQSAGRVLGMTRDAVSRKAKKLGLPEPDGPGDAMRDPPPEWIPAAHCFVPPLTPSASAFRPFSVRTESLSSLPSHAARATNWFVAKTT